jgi:AcrR family transcriptional regulator
MKTRRAKKITPHWPTRSDGRARFQVLTAAVVGLLADFGPSEITIQSIAARAHVPKGTVYTFFPSVEASLLAQAQLYLDEFDALARRPVPGARSWQEAWRAAAARARDLYVGDVARMRLLLGADIPRDVQTAGYGCLQRMGRTMAALLDPEGKALVPDFADICVQAIEINDTFWRLSFQRAGTIGDAHFEEGMRASLAYLAIYLPMEAPASAQ